MSFQKFKTNSYCVGPKHYFGTKNIVSEITFDKNQVEKSSYQLGNVQFVIEKNQ